MDIYNKVAREVNVWNQAVVALGFTSGLTNGPFIIVRAIPGYLVLPYLVPRKEDTGTSAAHEGKLSVNWKGPFRIKEDLEKGALNWNSGQSRGTKKLECNLPNEGYSFTMTKVPKIQESSPFPKMKPRNYAENHTEDPRNPRYLVMRGPDIYRILHFISACQKRRTSPPQRHSKQDPPIPGTSVGTNLGAEKLEETNKPMFRVPFLQSFKVGALLSPAISMQINREIENPSSPKFAQRNTPTTFQRLGALVSFRGQNPAYRPTGFHSNKSHFIIPDLPFQGLRGIPSKGLTLGTRRTQVTDLWVFSPTNTILKRRIRVTYLQDSTPTKFTQQSTLTTS
ncbi:hypothetical protein PIB30_073789 [Stylosanthes scabra]|uniref:Uncharacterized protein n=1 Tax=Stylosanthes scabra TaxID=79078 RepID=A0ABU6ZN34_9FABA|nr:hypothetical protein [Stylosanthes scabra]